MALLKHVFEYRDCCRRNESQGTGHFVAVHFLERVNRICVPGDSLVKFLGQIIKRDPRKSIPSQDVQHLGQGTIPHVIEERLLDQQFLVWSEQCLAGVHDPQNVTQL